MLLAREQLLPAFSTSTFLNRRFSLGLSRCQDLGDRKRPKGDLQECALLNRHPGADPSQSRARLSKIGADAFDSVDSRRIDRPEPAVYKLMVLSFFHVAPGRGNEYLNYVKNDLMPVQKKGQVKPYLVNHVICGGDPNEYPHCHEPGEMGGTSAPAVRALGEEGAAKLGIVSSHAFCVLPRLIGICSAPSSNLRTTKRGNRHTTVR
jgi:hypothetical protein